MAASGYFPSGVSKATRKTIAADYLIDFFDRQNFAMITGGDDLYPY